ncbi:MAG: threonine synthase [Ruminococcus sp.]|jgi:threonine synthase|nr:threonine synthase [Ruminococcus sp.]
MLYESTRNSAVKIPSAQAIVKGISEEGGLFVPSSLPSISLSELEKMKELSYSKRAEIVFTKLLTDFSADEIAFCAKSAYGKNFNTAEVAKTVEVGDATILELWHGPTSAFKDMALQILPFLMTTSMKKTENSNEIIILTATSGDTGKAALEGFADVPGVRIAVFYPENGVSEIQKLQMATQSGSNVLVCAVTGNFDDCQTAVKKIFTDKNIAEKAKSEGKMFSSANSINLGRLVPQVVYYVSAYVDMVKNNALKLGEKINICVPTGNFGNILAAYYAKQMGVPVNKLICASNENKILTDFISTGVYDKNREFITTISPSMDILISSNLERLLYHLCGNDSEKIVEMYSKLNKTEKFLIDENVFMRLKEDFVAGYCDDKETKEQIKDTFDKYSYLCDTHTAVAVKVYNDYKTSTGDSTPTVIASTANPYKFSTAILSAFGETAENDFDAAKKLNGITKMPIPEKISELQSKQVRFADSRTPESLPEYVIENLLK